MKRIALLSTSVLLLAGCAATPSVADDTIHIVASTNVYGDIAQTIGGDLVTVTSLIDGAAQDPHSFEASAQDQLALSKADLVIENGGGYDPFIDTLLDASGSTAVVLSAVDASGLLDGDHDHEAEGAETEHTEDDGHDHIEGFNEHVWYSLHGMIHVTEHLGEELAELDPTNAETYEANTAALISDLEALETRAEDLGGSDQSVAVTEPVPVYLLEAAGLANATPEAFTEAIEEGGDVPPLALQETLALFSDDAVILLAYNDQTASPETERVREAADDAGIPVLNFTETLPDGQDYVSWMTSNLDQIAAVLQ